MEDEIESDQMINRDLSTWRIEVPSIELLRKDDPAARALAYTNERIFAFRIDVRRLDVEPGSNPCFDLLLLKKLGFVKMLFFLV